MASYPTSVKTFTSKSDGAGNRIFASHVNDIQDEVTAIEDGLLNGTAPVNSSRATVASLSVAGNSTIFGSVTIGTDLGVQGNVLVSGRLVASSGLQISGASSLTSNVIGGGAVQWTSERSTTMSTGDTHNLDARGLAFLYVTTKSSGSTLTGMIATGNGQTVMVWNAGPAVLGLKNGAGSASTNQFLLGTDTNLAVGYGRLFYKSATVNQWVRVG
jgi:hypothetical protein